MLVMEFFAWWYGRGWMGAAQNAVKRMQAVLYAFSVPMLIRTLFAPWRRIVAYPGAGLDEHLRAAADNAVSRVIGFSVRLIVLLTAGICWTAVLIFSVVQLVSWPLLPLAVVAALVKGIIG